MSNTACEITEKFRDDQGPPFIGEEEGGAVQFPNSYKLWIL